MPGSNVFGGDTFCVSGAFTISQNEMKELIIKNGGHIAATASRACAYVVSDQIGSSKTQKAVKDGIPVVNEAWIHVSVKTGKKSTNKAHFLSGSASESGSSVAPATKTKPAKKGKKRAKDEEDEEEEEDEEAAPKSRKAAKASATSTPASSSKPKAAASSSKKGRGASASPGSSVFAALTFCVSGAFSISQGDMKKLIEENGGSIAGTPNKKCNYVVSDQIGSAKTMKAIKDGIPVVTEKWVQDSISSRNVIQSGKGYFLKEEGDDDDDDENEAGEDNDGDEKMDGGNSDDEENVWKIEPGLRCEPRSYPLIRQHVIDDHAKDLESRLSKVKRAAWFYKDDLVQKYTSNLFTGPLTPRQWGHPVLSSLHIRPLQWYGCRMRNLSRGWVTSESRSNWEEITLEGFKNEDHNLMLNESTYVWTVASFAILDANQRAFPFIMEYESGCGDSNTTPSAFIYTCKSSSDDSIQPGPDVCVSRIVTHGDAGSTVTVDLPRLRAALPLFDSSYSRHSVEDTAHSHCQVESTSYCGFHTAVDWTKHGYPHDDCQRIIFPAEHGELELQPILNEWKKDSYPGEKAEELLADVNLEEPFAEWRSKFRKFYAGLSSDEFLQNQLEVMFGAAAQFLFKVPEHLFTENQPKELRHKLTVEALTKLTPQQAKAFTSAALPPVSLNASSSSQSKWPHAEAIWGPAVTRRLPNELIQLIAEYTLDELELVDLPLIKDEQKEGVEDAARDEDGDRAEDGSRDRETNPGIFRGSELVFGTPPEDGNNGDYNDDT